MLKKYTAKSHVALSVILPNGKSVRVSFTPVTGGGSAYFTESPNMQAALESHQQFNKLFKEDIYAEEQMRRAADKAAKKIEKKEKDNTPKVIQVKVSCLDDAKEYLVENFDFSRTKLRSAAAIKKAAEASNIEFIGI